MVQECDVEYIAFLGPDNKKYTFKVIPFGPANAAIHVSACVMADVDDISRRLGKTIGLILILRDLQYQIVGEIVC